MLLSLSKQDAKRITIRAQRLSAARPDKQINIDDVSQVIRAMGLLQIDSVNVCVRSHYMPIFSRLGVYDQDLLDQLAYKEKAVFETWAHAACFVPVEDHRLFRPRMNAKEPRRHVVEIMANRPGYLEGVLQQVREQGLLTASELDGAGKRSGPWWGYTTGKIAAEWHFAVGALSIADRRNFARYYDLTERVIPERHLNVLTPSEAEAHREMMLKAVTAHGVGTAEDFADYYHLKNTEARTRLNELVEMGAIREVEVEDWNEPAYAPLKIESTEPTHARALLTPFDPLVWNRGRIERIFDFFYRIEIYVPEKKRQYGYYVYPFLLGEDLVARVDLKADRHKGVLQVKSAFAEKGQDHDYVASNLTNELRLMAGWLGLDRVVAGRKGNLIPALRSALKN
ncbi:MAG: winged helix-turn-helix domain-containing protein [Chloroflexi bacterium]|nr:winged helix-turn-helix domain-containing protein [Chloroflexota bacterium]